MMKIKYIYGILALMGITMSLSGQQLGQFNHYMKNPYLINPAASNTYEDNELHLGYRKQWTGFDDGPTTFYFFGIMDVNQKAEKSYKSYSLRISDPKAYKKYQPQRNIKFKQTMGGMVFNDVTRFTTHTAANLSYAINIELGEEKDKDLSIGVLAGIKNFKFNRTDVTVLDEGDLTYDNFLNYNEATLYYDFGFGAWFDAPKYYAGYSALQIPGENFSTGGDPSSFKILMHHFLQAGYKLTVGDEEDILVVPGFLLRYVSDVPFSYDINVMAYLKDDYWCGLAYRNNAYASILIGMNYKKFKFGYAFDYNTTGIRSYNSGSHEIIAAVIF